MSLQDANNSFCSVPSVSLDTLESQVELDYRSAFCTCATVSSNTCGYACAASDPFQLCRCTSSRQRNNSSIHGCKGEGMCTVSPWRHPNCVRGGGAAGPP